MVPVVHRSNLLNPGHGQPHELPVIRDFALTSPGSSYAGDSGRTKNNGRDGSAFLIFQFRAKQIQFQYMAASGDRSIDVEIELLTQVKPVETKKAGEHRPSNVSKRRRRSNVFI